jgi:dienelactone hydrolase
VRSLVVLIALVRVASAAPDDAVTAAMTALVAQDFTAVASAYEPASAPSPGEIARTWRAKTAGLGAATSWAITDRTRQDGFETRMVRIELEHGALACLVSIAPDSNRLVSMFISKPAAPARYVDHARFHDERVSIGTAPYVLGATLSVPSGPGPFPAVVLVHGSGPNDRDETVGSTKVFADIAEGLASAGIVALRFDKRTFTYGDKLTNALSLDDEVIDDAVAAVRFVAARHDVSKTIVVGHSLGGLLAPEIGVRAKSVAGVVLLAPPGRAPWDIVLGQMRYLHAPTASLRELERAITVIDIGGSADILGMPFSYWHDWSQRDGVAMVKQLGKPVLVLHGDRDYQVIDADIAVWRAGLVATKLARFVTLAGDNHLLVTGHGPPNPTEYKLPAHVDARAIDQIIRFVTSMSR